MYSEFVPVTMYWAKIIYRKIRKSFVQQFKKSSFTKLTFKWNVQKVAAISNSMLIM